MVDTLQSQLAWDPFSDPTDVLAGRRTEYEDSFGASQARVGEEPWDPFEDHEMLEFAGDISMESGDAGALEAWIDQALAAKLPDSKIQPKRDRVQDLRLKFDDAKRSATSRRLEDAVARGDRDSLRKAITEAARAGAHPEALDAASLHLQTLKSAESAHLREVAAKEAVSRKARDEELAKAALSKAPTQRLSPDEKMALERHYVEMRRPAEEPPNHPPAGALVQLKLTFPDGMSEVVTLDTAERGAALLPKLFPFKRAHPLPSDLGIFLPDGEALDLGRPLLEQGVRQGSALRIDDASLGAKHSSAATALMSRAPPQSQEELRIEAADAEEEEEEEQWHSASVKVQRWFPVYWPLTCREPTDEELQAVRNSGSFVVVLGWNAGADAAVAAKTVEAMSSLRGQASILTGEASLECAEGHKLRDFHARKEYICDLCRSRVDVGSALSGCRRCDYDVCRSCSRKVRPPPEAAVILKEAGVRSGVFLNVANHAGNLEVSEAVQGCLKKYAAKPGDPKLCLALIVVSRCFQSRRIASLVSTAFRDKAERLEDDWEKIDVIPFICGMPDLDQVAEDIDVRSSSILAEADLMLQLCPDAFDAEGLERLEELRVETRSERPPEPTERGPPVASAGAPESSKEVRPAAKRAPNRRAERKPEPPLGARAGDGAET